MHFAAVAAAAAAAAAETALETALETASAAAAAKTAAAAAASKHLCVLPIGINVAFGVNCAWSCQLERV